MIKFLKVNDPYRFGILIFAFILIRSLIFFYGSPLTHIELPYLLSARAIAEGKWIYKDIWETTEPLTSFVIYLLPKEPAIFCIFSYWINVILIIFNAFYANYFIQKLDVFSDKTFVPALFYTLISLMFFELNVLSAPLLASTFLLLTLSNIFSYLKKENLYRMYDSGFFLGISTLFFLPCIAFTPAIFLGMLLFTRSNGKGYFLLLLGLIFPWAILCILFLWVEGLQDFFNIFVSHYFSNYNSYIHSSETLVIFLLPTLLFLLGMFFGLKGSLREINFQSISRKFVLFWLFGGVFACIIAPVKSFTLLYVLIFPLAFFYSFYFLRIKAYILPNIGLFMYVGVATFLQYRCLKGTIWQETVYQIKVGQNRSDLLDGKRILITGNNQDSYLYSKVAGRYLNWNVSQEDFAHLDKFYAIENIRKNFYTDLPECILDQSDIIPKFFEKIPRLKQIYKAKEKGLYILQRKE